MALAKHMPPDDTARRRKRRAANHYVQTKRWIRRHPEAYALFVKYALELALRRKRRFGIKLIAERVRWEAVFEWGEEDFKINNNYPAYIARRLVREYPSLEGRLEFRMVRSGPEAGMHASGQRRRRAA